MTRLGVAPRFRARTILLVWLLLELFAAAQVRHGPERLLTSWFRALVHPLGAAATGTVGLLRDTANGLRDMRTLIAENAILKRKLEEERARNLVLRAETELLRQATILSQSFPSLARGSRVTACVFRVVGEGILQVNAGDADGIRVDTPALSSTGIVGRVTRVGVHSSWVETVQKANAAVAVLAGEDRIPGLATGTGTGVLRVEYIPRRATLVTGDLVVTSGTDGIYPPGLPVARITRIRETPGALLEVEARPLSDFVHLELVLLIPGWAPEDAGEVVP